MTNLKEIEAMADKFGRDLHAVKREIRTVQSRKCHLGQKKFAAGYQEKMQALLTYERVLIEVRQLLDPKEKKVTQYEQDDVDQLDYDQVVKALKSIQSKKSNCQYETENIADNDNYQNAVRIENMLKARRELLAPATEKFVRKTDIQTVIDTIKMTGKIKISSVIEMLENLIAE